MRNGKYNKKPFTDCFDCWKKKTHTSQGRRVNDSEDVSTESSAVSFEISANSTTTSSLSKVQVASMGVNSICSKTLTLNDDVFENGDWKLRLAQPHPIVWLMVATECSDYEEFEI